MINVWSSFNLLQSLTIYFNRTSLSILMNYNELNNYLYISMVKHFVPEDLRRHTHLVLFIYIECEISLA